MSRKPDSEGERRPGYDLGSLLGGLNVRVSLRGPLAEMDPQLGGGGDIPGYYTIAGWDTGARLRK